MAGQPADRAADDRAGGAAQQEPVPGQAMAGADGVRLLDADRLVHIGRVEQRRMDAHAQARDHPATRLPAKGHRPDAVDRHDLDRPAPLPEVAGAAHQGPGGAGPDEQHVQLRELAGDGRCRRAVVGHPVARIGVLVEPHVPVVGGAQLTEVVEPRPEEAAPGVRLGDDMHLAAQRLHEQPGRQVAAGVGHAQEPVALAGRDHAQGDAQVAGRGLDQDRLRRQAPVPLGAGHHLGRRLQLDRAGEVEALALQEERLPEDRPEVDVEVVLVEGLGDGDDRHRGPLNGGATLRMTAALAAGRRCSGRSG
jgi:hypothetical protein